MEVSTTMHFGTLILSKSRRSSNKSCNRKACDNPLLPETYYIGIVGKTKSGARFTKRCHPECFIEWAFDTMATRAGIQDERRAQGLTPKGGRPRLNIDDETRKVRKRLQIYCYRDQKGLEAALAVKNPARINRHANKLAMRLMEIAKPEIGGGIKINLSKDLRTALAKHIGGSRYLDGEWQTVRDPEVLAAMITKELCTDGS